WCCRSCDRLAALARDDDGVVVHTADSDDGTYSFDKFIRPTRCARSGMTGEEHGIDWNELHAGTPAKA
ncbi:MAG: hypothetical protein ABF524_03090, partial [Bifidobacterium aquikefiri]